MKIQIIEDWWKKDARCYFCGETRSVKYMVVSEDLYNGKLFAPCCNACAWKSIGGKTDEN